MKIESTKDLITTTFINLKETLFTNKNGRTGHWVWAQRVKKQNAVVIAALNKADPPRLLVIREFRVPLQDYEWGFPAGLIEPEERPADAARRELFEETGLTISKIKHISPLVYNTAGLTDEGAYMAFVEAEGILTTEHNEETESIETFLMTQEEIEDLLRRTDVKIGAKACLIMRYFAKFGEIF